MATEGLAGGTLISPGAQPARCDNTGGTTQQYPGAAATGRCGSKPGRASRGRRSEGESPPQGRRAPFPSPAAGAALPGGEGTSAPG